MLVGSPVHFVLYLFEEQDRAFSMWIIINTGCIDFQNFSPKYFFWEKLMKYKGFTITVFIIASSMNVVLYVYIGNYEIMNEICNYISFIAGISALICIGKMYLDYTNEMYSYCSGLSYYFYIVHLPVVVLCQYFISLTGIGCIYNFVLSFVISVIITCGMCFTFCGGKIIFEVKWVCETFSVNS